MKSASRWLEQRLSRSRQRLEVAGLSRTVGLLLVEESRNLPHLAQYRAQLRTRSNTLAEIGLEQVRIREERRELTSVDVRVAELMARVDDDVTDADELEATRGEVRLLLQDRHNLLTQAENTHGSYLQVLGDLDVAQRRLLDTASEYQEFLGQNMLWIPSAPIVFTGQWSDLGPESLAALSPQSWLTTASDLVASLRQHLLAAVVAMLLLLALLLTRKPLRKIALSMNDRIGRLSSDNIGLTLAALAIAAIRAAPLAVLLAITGWFLNSAEQPAAFSAIVASALLAVAPFLYNVRLFRVLCQPGGVMQAHFGWNEEHLGIIRRQLDRVVAIGAPLVFGTVIFYASDVAFDRATMSRLLYLALMIVLAVSFRPLAHPESGVAASYYRLNPDNWLSKLRWAWYGLAVGTPLLLCALSLLGYLYTSLILTSLMVDTIWLALGLVVINLVVLRWIALTHRKLALKLVLKEREAQKAAREEETEEEGEGELPAFEETPLDLEEVDSQTRKLLRWGLLIVAAVVGWGIWSEVFPAFQLFDQVSLWSQTVVVDGVETIVPVTLADVLLALFVAAATVVASRNLPGLFGNRDPAAPVTGYRQSLRHHYAVALRRRHGRHSFGAQHHWLELVANPMAGGGTQRRPRFWPAGDRGQLCVRSYYPVRASDTRWRYGHRWPALGHRVAGADSRDHHHRLGPQGDYRTQQGVYHRAGRQLDTGRPDHACRRTGRYFLRL